MTARILAADDDERMGALVFKMLTSVGYEVVTAGSGTEALNQLTSGGPFDLAVLDYELGDMDAVEILDLLRRRTGHLSIPVIIFTGKRIAPNDQVVGLQSGAVDYIEKGTDRAVFLARVAAALRHKSETGRIELGELVLEPEVNGALLAGRELKLERKQFLVLLELARNWGRFVSAEGLLKGVWGTEYEGFQQAVPKAIHGLRQALGEGWIETKQGVGYRLLPRR